MKVSNVHERALRAAPAGAAALLDSLASDDDRLWPREHWPAMRFDRPLARGGVGGHGPVRYVIDAYAPGESIRFRFTAPKGFVGTHGFSVTAAGDGRVVLRHVLEMRTAGGARFTWPLFFRPLHDALIEDAFDKAEARLTGQVARPREWSWYVRILRRAVSAVGRARRGPGPGRPPPA